MEEKEIDERFQMINNKFMMWEMRLNRVNWDIERKHMLLGMRIGNAIISSPFYKWGSLDSFMVDFIGNGYSKGYTEKDWNRHFDIENLKKYK